MIRTSSSPWERELTLSPEIRLPRPRPALALPWIHYEPGSLIIESFGQMAKKGILFSLLRPLDFAAERLK